MDDTVLVSGLPRSGTSLMMRMLEAGGLPVLCDHLRQADEDNPQGYYEFEPVKRTREDPSWLAAAAGKAVKLVYKLLYDLPSGYRYRVLFMRRRMKEVLASQRQMLQRQGREVPVDDTEMEALFQRDVSRCEEWLRDQTCFIHLDVDYNDLVHRPRETARAVNAFLDGALDEEAMCRVVEPRLHRNRL